MKKLILTLSLASLAVACRSTADVSDTSGDALPSECTAAQECPEGQASCCDKMEECDEAKKAECEKAMKAECDMAQKAECEGDQASCEDAAEPKVCPVTGQVIEN